MIKYLFSDIDGTLYVREDVAKNDVNACHKFIETGGVFSLATGRTDLEIVNFAKQEKFPKPRFRISGNGAVVFDDEVLVFESQFSQKAKIFLKNYLATHVDEFVIVEISTKDHIYFLMDPEEWVLNYKDDKFTINSDKLADFDQLDFNIMKMYIEGNAKIITELINEITTKYDTEIEIFSDITAVNLGPKSINKGTGINKILTKYGIKPEEIAVIGDAANDIGMFEITPNSFTFDYAKDFVKTSANYIVKNVAEAIEIIIKKNRDEESKNEL
ncbi:MAG: HAD-IIB family hydrolase [Culicoidibacterales bacterium]